MFLKLSNILLWTCELKSFLFLTLFWGTPFFFILRKQKFTWCYFKKKNSCSFHLNLDRWEQFHVNWNSLSSKRWSIMLYRMAFWRNLNFYFSCVLTAPSADSRCFNASQDCSKGKRVPHVTFFCFLNWVTFFYELVN